MLADQDIELLSLSQAITLLETAFHAVPYWEFKTREMLAGAMWYVEDQIRLFSHPYME